MRIQDELADVIEMNDTFNDVEIAKIANLNFKKELERYLKSGLTVIESIAAYCEDQNIEPDEIISYIDQNILSDITQEASKNRLLKKRYRVNAVQEI